MRLQIEFPNIIEKSFRWMETASNNYFNAIVIRLLNTWMKSTWFGIPAIRRHLGIRFCFDENKFILIETIGRYNVHIEWCILSTATENIYVIIVTCNFMSISPRWFIAYIFIALIWVLPRACVQIKSGKSKKKGIGWWANFWKTEFCMMTKYYLWISHVNSWPDVPPSTYK